MKSSTLLLVDTFLKSTSPLNVLRYGTDKKKRNYAKNTLIGQIILYVLLTIYVIVQGVGLTVMGAAKLLPDLCAILLFLIPLLFTLLKANGYLFGYKEYDAIMSMPFAVKDIVSAKFLYMYLRSFPIYGLFSLGLLIVYGISGNLHIGSCLAWIVLTFVLPILPMVIASALGILVIRIGSMFKNKNIVEAMLIIVLLMPLIFGRFFLESAIKNDELEDLLSLMVDSISGMERYIPFAKDFGAVINEGRVSSFLWIVGLTVCIYEVFFLVVSKFYRAMNSQLAVGAKHKKYEMTSQEQKGIVQSIAYKEFKRMTGSSIYLTNGAMGYIMTAILGTVLFFVKSEAVLASMMPGAPVTPEMIYPAVPVFLYFLVGMVPTTCCSPSLEGKNYWIMQTLPIDPIDDYKGKALFNLYLAIPVGIYATIGAGICFRVSVLELITSLLAIVSLCVLSTVRGLYYGIKYRRLDWENEVEVVKQGMAVSLYLIPQLIICLLFMPGFVLLNMKIHNVPVLMIFLTLVAWSITLFNWSRVKRFAK